MKNKLLLKEEEDLVVEEPIKEIPEEIPMEQIHDFNISSFATELIKNKWEQVDNINGMLMTMPNLDPNTAEILKSVVSDEYVHIGQLEKIVQGINPEAEALDAGDNEEEIK